MSNRRFYERRIEEYEAAKRDMAKGDTGVEAPEIDGKPHRPLAGWQKMKSYDDYERLCRGEQTQVSTWEINTSISVVKDTVGTEGLKRT